MDVLGVCLFVVAALGVLASAFLTAASFVRLIARFFGHTSPKQILRIWLIIACLYLLSEIVVGYGLELLFFHLNVGADLRVVALDLFDASIMLYGIVDTFSKTIPSLPLIGENKTSAFALSFGLFLYVLMGSLVMMSWLPETFSLITRIVEVIGFALAYFLFRYLF